MLKSKSIDLKVWSYIIPILIFIIVGCIFYFGTRYFENKRIDSCVTIQKDDYNTYKVFVDPETGVNYLVITNVNVFKDDVVIPRYNEDGTLMVTKEIEE